MVLFVFAPFEELLKKVIGVYGLSFQDALKQKDAYGSLVGDFPWFKAKGGALGMWLHKALHRTTIKAINLLLR
jgi:hypothetical protein